MLAAESLLKYLLVFSSSMFKFILGPVGGLGFGFPVWQTALLTVGGMMTSITLVTYFGLAGRAWYNRRFRQGKKPLFTPRNRRIVRIWRRYGIVGVAFLTPLIFSPILGTLIAVSFGENKRNILLYMFVFTFFWAWIFSAALHFGGKEVLALLGY